MESTKYSTEMTIQKILKNILKSEEGKLESICLLTCFSDTNQEVFCVSLLKCFAIFNKSSHGIYLMWYNLLLFFLEFTSSIPFKAWFWDSCQIKGSGYFFKSSIVCEHLAEVYFLIES